MSKKFQFVLFILLMFGFRIFLAVNAKHGDMYNSLDWGYGAAKYGLAQFYDLPQAAWPHSRPNQPPGSIYLHLASVEFSVVGGKIISWMNSHIPLFLSRLVWWWEWNGELAAIKLPPIIADFAIAAAILTLGRMAKKYKESLIVAIVWLVNPALWYSSAFWGHTDAVIAALSIWSFVALFQKRTFLSPLLLGLSFVIKASWLFAVPFYIVYFFINYPRKFYYTLVIPAAMFVVSLPFHPHLQSFLPWFWDLYVHRVLPGDYTFITILAFNFWNLVFGPNFISLKTPFLGIPANMVGWTIVILSLLLLAVRLVKNPKPQVFAWSSMLLAFAVFLFAPKMIHRYLYPAFPLLSLSLVYVSKKKIIWIAYIVMSICYLVNLYYKWWAPGNLWLESWYTDAFTRVISVIYLGVFALLVMFPRIDVKKD